MSHESSHWANIGSKNPQATFDQFKSVGASDSQAADAAAAAKRAQQSGSKS